MPSAKPAPAPATAPGGGPLKSAGTSREGKARPAFPSKRQPPQPETYAASLPPADARRLEAIRVWLTKQKGVSEALFYYGPSSGWGLRYLLERVPLCALFVMGQRPVAVVHLDATADAEVDWESLSESAREARQVAEGGAAQIWLDLPLTSKGQADLRTLVKARLASA